MTRIVLIDLDDAGDVDRLVSAWWRHHDEERRYTIGHQTLASYRAQLEKRIEEAVASGRATEALGDQLRAELAETNPALFAVNNYETIIPAELLDAPALGAVKTSPRSAPPPSQRELESACHHMIEEHYGLPLRDALAGLAELLVAKGADPGRVRGAFRTVLRESGRHDG